MAHPFRLLFVDDRRGAQEGFLAEVARPLGADVEVELAASLEGVEQRIARGELFDVVVSDLSFEQVGGGPKDGLLILAAARRAWPEAELLLHTAFAGSLGFDDGLELARHGLAAASILRKAADDSPSAGWARLRERIAGLRQARQSAAEPRGELLREQTFRRRRDLAATLRELADGEVAKLTVALHADPESCRHGMIGRSFALRDRLDALERIARLQRSALVVGETGTGKELAARALHAASPRRTKPFVKSDLAALPAELVAAELFGHERGAYTGADRRRRGLFAEADGGTLFLDEIGNLAPELQPLLLRVLQERTFRPVGGERDVTVDVFVIAATNADLEQQVAAGRFRADLLERLAVHRLELPPLRERREDIPLLAVTALAALRERYQATGFARFDAAALELLAREAWPRNVRQLENALERLFVEFDPATPRVTADHVQRILPARTAGSAAGHAAVKPLAQRVLDGEERATLRELEKRHGRDAVGEVIEQCFLAFAGPPDDEQTARLFDGMKANTWRQFAWQRGYTWEKVRRGEGGKA
ncbi:MAG: sigma-54-dependent Fis family transcriptional regulator [Planctomycetes bacterium]|nr:sigma-54-dependent Fis family transcriptional regulator [Planctomycetota bacterium]